MKRPRGLSGTKVVRRLARHYGYRVTRSRGSHMTVTLTAGGEDHQVTVPRHRDVRIGTLDASIVDVAVIPGLRKQAVRETLFS